MEKNDKVYVAGHTGLVGSALLRVLEREGYTSVITRRHNELDLTRQKDVEVFFASEKPQYVILAAARVGGIHANTAYAAEFIYENLAIQTNVIHSAYVSGVKRMLFLGSACGYPRECRQPMKEEYLMTGPPETTNEPYAVAKLAGIKLCQAYNRQYLTDFICAIPANIYGPHDRFDPDSSHVIPALIKRFHEAKIRTEEKTSVWGTGSPHREFIYADDLANACLFLMRYYNGPDVVNIGTGEKVTVKKLARMVKDIVGYEGEIAFDPTKPDGMPCKTLDTARLREAGWRAQTRLNEGLAQTYTWYQKERSITL
ncbi:MAG: GDP-L-fucose synthase [Candidatus Omnitrophota bacterium]